MCEPTTIMLAITAATAVAGVVSQQNAADSQAEFNTNQAKNLMLSRGENANQINLQRVQSTDAAGQKINANNTALREAQATSLARAGPSGLSVDALLSDMGRKGATYNESVNANLDRTNLALDSQLTNVNSQTTSGFNQMKTPQAPDYLGTALKIGSSYMGASNASGSTNSAANTNWSNVDYQQRGLN